MENKNNWQDYQPECYMPERCPFPTGKRELLFGISSVIAALAFCNFTAFGGFHLGFAIGVVLCILSGGGYLLASGCKPGVYSTVLLVLSMVIAAGFARSADGFVKFVMICFLLVSVNLGLCLLAGKNKRRPGGVSSLLDAPAAVFAIGIGKLPESFLGLKQAFRSSGTAGKKSGAFILGLCIAVPIMAILIPLLVSADAAFDALVGLLPRFDLQEAYVTAFLGGIMAVILYGRGTALRHASVKQTEEKKAAKKLSSITINTVLCCVCIVYGVYLISQLAYFVGGFAGILPEAYSLAQYARRGFFEMAWLCAIDLGIISLSIGLVKKQGCAPLSTRIFCLLIGIVTLFFVAAASAKMFLYIDSFGLTRLRVLTQIVMLFLGLTTGLVLVWLFVPKLPYMKAVMLAGLIIGAAVIWADVDTQVANYNVQAYLSGKTETVDVDYLEELTDGAIPAIAQLEREAKDPVVVGAAKKVLETLAYRPNDDFRSWNYVNHEARKYLRNLVE